MIRDVYESYFLVLPLDSLIYSVDVIYNYNIIYKETFRVNENNTNEALFEAISGSLDSINSIITQMSINAAGGASEIIVLDSATLEIHNNIQNQKSVLDAEYKYFKNSVSESIRLKDSTN